MALPVGAKAPDITLKGRIDGEMKELRLSDVVSSEAVVLLFFPAAFSGACEKEMCETTQGLGTYAELGAAVYGISPDNPFAQAAWAKRADIGVTLLSDYQREVTRAYDVVWPDFAGLGPGTARAAFVIDRSGVVRYSEQMAVLGELPNFDAIRATLKSLVA
ncbi:MAG: redoxin domain-containing protein [Fimbriimonas ginsengisoli]|nr:redoxin domain-containing protein [Fimbriimonas ginsengisoli]